MRRKHKCRLAVAREAVSAYSLPVIVARQHFPQPEHLAEANPEGFPARHAKGQEAHFHCRKQFKSYFIMLQSRQQGPGSEFRALWRPLSRGSNPRYKPPART